MGGSSVQTFMMDRTKTIGIPVRRRHINILKTTYNTFLSSLTQLTCPLFGFLGIWHKLDRPKLPPMKISGKKYHNMQLFLLVFKLQITILIFMNNFAGRKRPARNWTNKMVINAKNICFGFFFGFFFLVFFFFFVSLPPCLIACLFVL